jgi:hypothetical protein
LCFSGILAVLPPVIIVAPIVVQVAALAQRLQSIILYFPVFWIPVQVRNGEYYLAACIWMRLVIDSFAYLAAVVGASEDPGPDFGFPIRWIPRVIYWH